MGKFIDITDQRFGFWVAKTLGPKNKNGHTQWLCKCECGKEKLVTLNSLRTGNSTSCGCNHAPNLENEKFGKLSIIKLDTTKNDGRRRWFCQCDCGTTISATTYQLRNDKIKSCGSCKEESVIPTLADDETALKLDFKKKVVGYWSGTKQDRADLINLIKNDKRLLDHFHSTY